MKLIVGGIGTLHDRLLCAALRGRGLAAEPLRTPDADALAAGRALLPRGHPSSMYYLAGAAVLHLREAAPLAGRYAVLTAGPHHAHYASDQARALAAAGFGEVAVAAISPERPDTTAELAAIGVRVDAPLVRAIARALLLGDVLVRAGCERRPCAAEPRAVDRAITRARLRLESALERGANLVQALAHLRADLPPPVREPRLRVRLTGDFFSAGTDGDGGGRLVPWLEQHGAVVEPPAVGEWLQHLCWHARTHAGAAAWRAEVALGGLYHRFALAAGLSITELPSPDELAVLAAPHYPVHLAAGTGHLEIATFLHVAGARSADLVVSVKPFASMTSSSVSDAVLHTLARRLHRPAFLALEISGDAAAHLESRLELAVATAVTSRAACCDSNRRSSASL